MKIALCLMSLFLLAGCVTNHSPTFHVTVNSYGEGGLNDGDIYFLVPLDKEVSINDLDFREFALCIERSLSEKGMKRVYDILLADVAIGLSYSISDPFVSEYTESRPIWGQTGISSSNTNANISLYGNSANYSETTTYTPQYGITGYREVQRTSITYIRRIELLACDPRESKPIWNTVIASYGSSDDLRRCFPVMVAAAKDYLGTSTGRKILVQIQEDNDAVKFVKGEIHEQKND